LIFIHGDSTKPKIQIFGFIRDSFKDRKDRRVRPESRDRKVSRVIKEYREYKEKRVIPEKRDLREKMGFKDRQELTEHPGKMALREFKAYKGYRDYKDREANVVNKDCQAHKTLGMQPHQPSQELQLKS
jgi:hypothetical protein